jgi:UDP-glucose 4-epimerase
VQHFLVTGGCGFIGSHLCAALVGQGHAVRVLDDLSTGVRANLAPGATLVEGTITDPATVTAALSGVDGCFHLAAIASVERALQDWTGTHRVNLTGTITIFEALARQGRRIPVVYASSAAVYGDCPSLPIVESGERVPLSAYGADKYACELQARVATHVYDIPSTGLRFFNVYGPRQDPRSPYSGVISIFCDRVRRGLPIEIFGDGQQTRDFVFVTDVVAVMQEAMARRLPGARVLNVCTGVPTSVLDLAHTIGALYGQQPEMRFRPARVGEIKYSYGSTALASGVLGFCRPTGLGKGLQEVLTWLDASEKMMRAG